jgi:hypothetical protein
LLTFGRPCSRSVAEDLEACPLGHHRLEELAQLNHVSSLLQDFAGLFVVAVLFVTIIIFSVLNLTLIAM